MISITLAFLHYAYQACANVASSIWCTLRTKPSSTTSSPSLTPRSSTVTRSISASPAPPPHPVTVDAAGIDHTRTLNLDLAERELQFAATLKRQIMLLRNISRNMKRQARRAKREAHRIQKRTGSEDAENLRLAETLHSEIRIIAIVVANKKRHVALARQRANCIRRKAAAHAKKARRVTCCFGS